MKFKFAQQLDDDFNITLPTSTPFKLTNETDSPSPIDFDDADEFNKDFQQLDSTYPQIDDEPDRVPVTQLDELLQQDHKYLSTILETTEDYDKTFDLVKDLPREPSIPTQEFNVMHFSVIPQFNFDPNISNVILGPCDEYTLDLYSGLKTQFKKEDIFLSKVPPITPDLSSLLTPCDSLEEHAMNTTFQIKTQAELIVKNVINDAEKIVTARGNSDSKYDIVPEVRNFVDDLIFKAEMFVADRMQNSSYLDSELTLTPQQLDSLEYAASNSQMDSSSLNKTVILKPEDGWFLHQRGDVEEDEEESPHSDNSYVGFSLDEECVAALRSELAAKLPHAQGPAIPPPSGDLLDEWECEPGKCKEK